jgi:ribosome biogenesis GTPase
MSPSTPVLAVCSTARAQPIRCRESFGDGGGAPLSTPLRKARGTTMDERKDRQMSRHMRGAKKFEQRRENLAEKKRRGGPRPQRPARAGVDDDLEEVDERDLVGAEVESDDATRIHKGRAPSTAATPAASNQERAVTARVIEVARTGVRVMLPDGRERAARVVPRVLAVGGLVVGDEVLLDGPSGGVAEDSRVVQRLARRTLLSRRDPSDGRSTKLLAANVDVGVVVLAPRADGLSLGFLERALAAFEAGGLAPLVVVTKVDLLDAAALRELEAALEPWVQAGVSVHFVGAPTGVGLAPLREALVGRVAVLLGHSGVGKSTLVNALDPTAAQPVGDVREHDGRGRHTTTTSRLIQFRPLADGPIGALVDTPGVRQLVPDGADVARLAEGLPELAPHLGRCRFRDCAHGGEPGCAVAQAAADDPRVNAALGRLVRLVGSLDR